MDQKKTGEFLKELRIAKQMTQEQVADALGVSRVTYLKWERYETYPDAQQLVKLADVFGCSLDHFYFPVKTN